jgi:nicotinamidase-related amidase
MHDRGIQRLVIGRAQLLVIDIQEKLFPLIHENQRVAAKSALMIKAARALDVPVTVSEQYVKGLGPTIAPLAEAIAGLPRCEKLAFSFCGEPPCRARIESAGRPQVLLVGIETHVCVQQTALDLLRDGMVPVVLADAVGSRTALDYHVALERMRSAGVIVTTTESAIFELLGASGTEPFKKILPLVK